MMANIIATPMQEIPFIKPQTKNARLYLHKEINERQPI